MPNRRYLEDLAVGERWTSPAPILVTAEEIIAFGRAFDPQPFHTDPELAKAGPAGGLIASGWHTAALAMRANVESRPFGDTPQLGLGVDELRWLKPVRPGDRLTVEREILAVIPSKTKPDRGTVRTRVLVRNQDSHPVLTYQALIQLPRRPATAESDAGRGGSPLG